MDHVTLTHPDLPGSEMSVRLDAVPEWQASGWVAAAENGDPSGGEQGQESAELTDGPVVEPDQK